MLQIVNPIITAFNQTIQDELQQYPDIVKKTEKPIEDQVIILTKENFNKEILESNQPIIIDIYSNWCPPCKKTAPLFSELSKEHLNIKFAKINIDNEQELAIELKVQSIPTLLFFKDGEIINRRTGIFTKDEFLSKVIESFL